MDFFVLFCFPCLKNIKKEKPKNICIREEMKILGVRKAAKKFGVSLNVLYRWRKEEDKLLV